MANVLIRNLSDEVHRAIRLRAVEHGCSTEAEIRSILESAVRPAQRLLLGTALHALGRAARLSEQDIELIESVRNRQPAQPLSFD